METFKAWSRRALQRWTLARVTHDRPRYRRCVDLGCGPGDWSELFAPLCDELYACDVSDVFVDQARARTAAHPLRQIERADLRAYAVPRGLDLAYLGAVLLYMSDADARDVLRRVRASAAPGAHVIIREYCTFNLGRRAERSSSGYSVHRRPRDVLALAEHAGLHLIEARSSPSIYAEVIGGPILGWPLRLGWRLGTLHWTRASHTFRFRA